MAITENEDDFNRLCFFCANPIIGKRTLEHIIQQIDLEFMRYSSSNVQTNF